MIFDFSSDKISRFLPSSFRFKNQYSWWHPVRIAHMEILSYNGYPSGALSSSAWFSALPSLSMRLLEFQKSFRQFWIFSLPRYETHDICSMHLFDKGEFVALMIKFLEKMYFQNDHRIGYVSNNVMSWINYMTILDLIRNLAKTSFLRSVKVVCQFLSGMSH